MVFGAVSYRFVNCFAVLDQSCFLFYVIVEFGCDPDSEEINRIVYSI